MSTASSIPSPEKFRFYCNDAPFDFSNSNSHEIELQYLSGISREKNVNLALPKFILKTVHYLPERCLDLLEIATYVYCADRKAVRGKKDAVIYDRWSREMEYHIKVRDFDFWQDKKTNALLTSVLNWITGDRSHSFHFYPGHSTPPTSLLDSEEFIRTDHENTRIVLFSGGLDSLSGIIDLLESDLRPLCLISHHSGNYATAKTVSGLVKKIQEQYPHRVSHSFFKCHLKGPTRPPEETQRTRAFLYCSMAAALAVGLNRKDFYMFENGITALNFGKRSGMYRARASRTVHPKTIRLLEAFYAHLFSDDVSIHTPFCYKTKTDIVRMLKENGKISLLNSSVSCSARFQENATHCGWCSQCVDRRFAIFAADCASDDDFGTYSFDFVTQNIEEGEVRTSINDFLRQAIGFYKSSSSSFYQDMISELTDAIDDTGDDQQQFELIFELCKRHGQQVSDAARKMVNPFEASPGSIGSLLGSGEFLLPEEYNLANKLKDELENFIRQSFSSTRPVDENDLNAKIHAYLSGHKEKYQKEYPSVSFATAKVVPDHSTLRAELLIETKYIRGHTSPSKVTSGIAEDLTKYPDQPLKLFIVYDPESRISDRQAFKSDFERKRKCIIHIV